MRNNNFRPIAVIAAILILIVVLINGISGPEKYVRDDYVKTAISADSVIVTGHVNIRSEPVVDGGINSYGTKSTDASIKISVSQVYEESQIASNRPLDPANGYFIGVKVSDIKHVRKWKKIFPKSITKDPDNIVWINCDYISVQK